MTNPKKKKKDRNGNGWKWKLLTFLLSLVMLLLILHRRWQKGSRLPLNRMEPVRPVKLDDFQFRTYDLLIYHGSGTNAKVTRLLTASPWTHVALVWVDSRTQVPYLWEATYCGTRLLPLREEVSQALKKKTSRVAVRRLVVAKGHSLPDPREMERCIRGGWNAYYNSELDLDYCRRFMHNTATLLFPFSQSSMSMGRVRRTCAHLTAEVLQQAGVVDFTNSGLDPSLTFPLDFGPDQTTHRIPYRSGYGYDGGRWLTL